jgi:glycosyltransferase involved in cell wall biosynthesis
VEHDSVTVLLTVFNGGPHLKEAVASVLSQTHPRFELLVVDDGSTDGSGEWLAALDDPRIRVVRQANRGLVAALNHGLEEARTDLVARMDADDISSPARLEQQARYLMRHPGVAAVGCCYAVVEEDGSPAEVMHVAGAPSYLRRRLYFRNTFAHASMTFRRSAALEVGGYRDVGPVEDYDLWVRLSARHDLAALPDVLFTYRRTTTGISASQRERQLESLARVRASLRQERPLAVPSARQLRAEGEEHVRRYGADCGDALPTYVFDHAWLAIHAARERNLGAAARLGAAVVLLVLRHPSGWRGLPGADRLPRRRRVGAPT